MKRNNLLLLFSFFLIPLFFFSCKRKPAEIVIVPDALKNHLQRVRLFENVKTVETFTYYFIRKDSSFLLSNRNVQYFSSDGFLNQVLIFDKNNDTVSNKKIYYLPNAKENFWKEYNYFEQSWRMDTFLYDKNGFKKEEQILLNDSLLYKIEYKTDAIGGVIEMKRFFSDYHLTNLFYYNDKGLVERIDEYDPDNKMYKYFTIEYDNYGDEVNRRAFKTSNEIIEYTYTQYDENGLLLKVIFEDRLHNYREDKIYPRHDLNKNWLEEIVLQGTDTVMKKVREICYY